MAENWIIEQTVELTRPVQPYVGQPVELMLPGDHLAHTLRIKCKERDMPVNLTGYTAAGYFKRTDGNTVLVVGSINGNVVDVTLSQECYAFPGNLRGVVRITNSTTDAKITLCDRLFHVGQAVDDGGTIDPGEVIPSLDDLLAEIDAMEQATAAAQAAAECIADDYSASATYAVGDYALHNGGLYRCTTAITSAETWTPAHWTHVVFGAEVADLKSAFEESEETQENLVFYVGLPATAERGGYNLVTGEKTTNTKRARIYDYDVIESNTYRINYPTTIRMSNMRQRVNGTYESSTTGYNNHVYTTQAGVDRICALFCKTPDDTVEPTDEEIAQIKIIPQSGLTKQMADVETALATVETTLSGKVDIAQGSENAGKSLVINSSGNIVPGNANDADVHDLKKSVNEITGFVGSAIFAELGGFNTSGVKSTRTDRARLFDIDTSKVSSLYVDYPNGIRVPTILQYSNGAYTSSTTGFSNHVYTVQNGVTKVCFLFCNTPDDTTDITQENLDQIKVTPQYSGLNNETYENGIRIADIADFVGSGIYAEYGGFNSSGTKTAFRKDRARVFDVDATIADSFLLSFPVGIKVYSMLQYSNGSYASSTTGYSSTTKTYTVQSGVTKFCVSFAKTDDTNDITQNEINQIKIIPQYSGLNKRVHDLEENAISSETILNVKAYGAKGDGTTDDTDAIAAAIAACPSGGMVFIPGGTYKISNIACKSNMTVKGEGRATILAFKDSVVPPSGASYNCLSVMSVSNVFIEDLTIDGNRTNNSTSSSGGADADDSFNCICIVHSDNVYIDNVWGHSAGYHGVIMVDVHHIEVKNSKFWDNGFRPIHGHSTVNDVKVIGNEVWANGQGFEGTSHSAYDAIFFFDDVHRLEIRDNYIHDSTNIGGIQIGGNYVGNGDPSSDIMIVGNFINNRNLEDDTKSQYGIHIMGDCVTNLSILDNSITGDRGVYMNNYHDRGANKNVSIIGNTIYNCKTYGIWITEAYYDCIISNNQIVGGTQAGVQIENNEKLTITGNIVVDFERGIHIKNGTDVVIASNVVEKRGASAPTMQASIKADDTNTNVWMIYNIVGRAVVNAGTGAITLPAS